MSRQAILSMLYSRVGFTFHESELSPALRRRLGDLESLKSLLDRAGLEVDALNHTKNSIWGYALILGLVGLVLLLFGIAQSCFHRSGTRYFWCRSLLL